MEERQIVELYNRRDEQAIAETERAYGAYCFSVANNILRDRADAEETVADMLMSAWNAIQLLDSKLLYEDDREEGTVKSYDLATGEIEVLDRNVGDFYVFEDRYVSFEYRNDGWGILDWQTGELTKVKHYPE